MPCTPSSTAEIDRVLLKAVCRFGVHRRSTYRQPASAHGSQTLTQRTRTPRRCPASRRCPSFLLQTRRLYSRQPGVKMCQQEERNGGQTDDSPTAALRDHLQRGVLVAKHRSPHVDVQQLVKLLHVCCTLQKMFRLCPRTRTCNVVRTICERAGADACVGDHLRGGSLRSAKYRLILPPLKGSAALRSPRPCAPRPAASPCSHLNGSGTCLCHSGASREMQHGVGHKGNKSVRLRSL